MPDKKLTLAQQHPYVWAWVVSLEASNPRLHNLKLKRADRGEAPKGAVFPKSNGWVYINKFEHLSKALELHQLIREKLGEDFVWKEVEKVQKAEFDQETSGSFWLVFVKEGQCPNCQSDLVFNNYVKAFLKDDSAIRNSECHNCKATWTEVFTLNKITDLVVPEKGP